MTEIESTTGISNVTRTENRSFFHCRSRLMRRRKKNYDWKSFCFDSGCYSFYFDCAEIDSVDLGSRDDPHGGEEGFSVDGFGGGVEEHCASLYHAPIGLHRDTDPVCHENEKEDRDGNAHWVGNPSGEVVAGRIRHDSGVGLVEVPLPKRLRRGCCSFSCLFVSRGPVFVIFCLFSFPEKKILLLWCLVGASCFLQSTVASFLMELR